jgi:tetratricopeptide (TPR) repeat protein
MKIEKRPIHFILLLKRLSWIALITSGCAHHEVPVKTFAEQTVRYSAIYEKKGDLDNAVEELKVAVAADPDNTAAREELKRIVSKRDKKAESHFRSGLALRESAPQKARKEFLEALKIRNDYPEAETELREIQLSLAVAVIQARTKKEERLAAVKMHGSSEVSEDDDETGEDYSLDVAITSYEKGDYDSAIIEFNKMKARYPNDPDIQAYLDRSYYNSGINCFKRRDYNRALALFTKVPKGFERVDDYVAKCGTALGIPDGEKVKSVPIKRR